MEDARTKFFANMEAERRESHDFVDIDFSVTESGRTVAHMVTESGKTEDDIDFSMTESGRAVDNMILSDDEREDLLKALETDLPANIIEARCHQTHAKPIPVPRSNHPTPAASLPQPSSQASSQGSSGSAFLSSVLNPTNQNNNLSHTPPTFGTSYEASHFGKRARSGSVSGRLRSASEYLEDKGLLDRQTKGILKDLLIIGDEVLQQAIDRYEGGDPSKLEEMIRSGALQERLPKDLDILGDLDLDFLAVHDDIDIAEIEQLENQVTAHSDIPPRPRSASLSSQTVPSQGNPLTKPRSFQPNMVSPTYDDGIGDLEFAGDFVSETADDMLVGTHFYGSKHTSAAASPAEATNLSEYEKRMRSNSLFSALLNDPKGPHGESDGHYGQWMESIAGPNNSDQGIHITTKANRRTSSNAAHGGIGASLEADQKKREKQEKKEKREREKQEKKEKKEYEKKKAVEEEVVEYIPGSGRPRALSDPNLRTTVDEFGLMHVDRPDGWVGAYSPESRRVRIGRFMEKRNHRVWTKTVKYDVRKNFADSRLRVKGRFVKKEDELLMRELMSLT